MKKHYILNFKNYILVTLYIISIILLISDIENFTIFIIAKIIGLIYFIIFTYRNIISPQHIFYYILFLLTCQYQILKI